MRQSSKLAFTLVILFACALPLAAHSNLERSEPKADETVKTSPAEVRIWFTEPIKATLSTIEVFDAAGKQIDKRDLQADKANPALVGLPLPPLAPGAYKVVWRVISSDLHATKGEFSFRVADGT